MNKPTSFVLTLAMICLTGSGCSEQPAEQSDDDQQAEQSNAQQVEDYPVIVQLVSRDQTITIKAGPDGPLYSVQTVEGQVLATDMAEAQFQAAHPALYERLESSLAGDGDVILDASNYIP